MPGYDLETGLLYLPYEGLDVVDVPDDPTDEDFKNARELILKPIAEFPFVTPDDKATWIGLAMTPALRQLFPPPYQMGIITATNPGSGKTLLTRLLTIVHGGVQRGEMPRDDAELRKSITNGYDRPHCRVRQPCRCCPVGRPRIPADSADPHRPDSRGVEVGHCQERSAVVGDWKQCPVRRRPVPAYCNGAP